MPLYEFRCTQCGTRFEKLVRNAEPVRCPRCGGAQVKKAFSTFATATPSDSSPTPSAPSCAPGG